MDGRLIALVGPNEAGKSSVLEALAWLSDEDSGALPASSRSRSLTTLDDATRVVEARFTLDEEDRAVLADLPTDDVPRVFVVYKLASGQYEWRIEPPLSTSRVALDAAEAALTRLETKCPALLEPPDDDEDPRPWVVALRRGLAEPDSTQRRSAAVAGHELRRWFDERLHDDGTTVRLHNDLSKCDQAVAAALDLLDREAPGNVAGERLWERRPEFLLFREQERVLVTEYNLDDPALLEATPPALVNLLALGDVDVRAVVDAYRGGDVSRTQSLLKLVNRLLRERLQPTWRQSQLAVALDINGAALHVLVDEIQGDMQTAIHERSDGLKTFIALVCFLARHRSDVPPVLMLDEAETHLHYDAQADLIDVLSSHLFTSKVIYTTHSPGCLPPDLGTGIRLVAPDGDGPRSTLRNNFWDSNEPGFSPLLFAMGAGAAAFSVCRRAVLAEGPSDMILLPSLIRLAAGVDELGYQVAPGLSAARAADLANAAIAARVVYLVDGDPEGQRYRASLMESHVDDSRVFNLPTGMAVEDLLAPSCYLQAVSGLMADAGWASNMPDVDALQGPGPVAARLRAWCREHGAPEPGKTAVASRLVQDPGSLVLTQRARRALRALHKRFVTALAVEQ